MDQINAAAAARRLGISEPAVRKMITARRLPNRARSGPALVASADVDRVMRERRTEAQRRHPDAAAYAAQVRRSLWPSEQVRKVTLADGRESIADMREASAAWSLPSGRDALRYVPDAVALFGRATMETAATPAEAFKNACRTCFADLSARVHGGLRPTDAPAYRVLLGEPCPADRQRWAAETIAQRRAMEELTRRETASRQAAQKERARLEFRAAQQDAETAAQRVRTAAQHLAALDPSVAHQAGVQARRRAGFTASGDMPCGCSADVYCPQHAAMFGTHDRRAARR
ncbi:hypothetical protein ACIGMX_02225 [Streptomyces aquilus]|uniref:hypothetical protein n=1 Tax=Streptomyces aquilus TaxID=2548456 RepID=UPI0037D91FE5